MNTPKEEMKRLIDEHFDGDATRAADVVSDLLMLYAEHVKATEPYATNSISALEKGAYGAKHLDSLFEE
jgi:hypothetical protein